MQTNTYELTCKLACSLKYLSCRYGDSTARATVEGNILFPFIPEDKLEDLQARHFYSQHDVVGLLPKKLLPKKQEYPMHI